MPEIGVACNTKDDDVEDDNVTNDEGNTEVIFKDTEVEGKGGDLVVDIGIEEVDCVDEINSDGLNEGTITTK